MNDVQYIHESNGVPIYTRFILLHSLHTYFLISI